MHHPIRYRRRGFTLIEMLVVMSIIVALLGLVAVVAPRFGERQRPSRGAGQVQSWLNLAKNRALRDQRPRGIRLPPVMGTVFPPPPAAPQSWYAYVTELQFIETPEVFSGGSLMVPAAGITMTPLASAADPQPYQFASLQNVELGDPTNPPFNLYDLLDPGEQFGSESDRMRRIVQINWVSGTSCFLALDRPLITLSVGQTPPPPPGPTEHYRIIRANRPIPGEPVLTLPQGVGIDISRAAAAPGATPSWYRLYPPTGNTGGNSPFDIMFDPAGRVVGYESTLGNRICLWVRDISADFQGNQMPEGDNTLITIYTRNGQIAPHPVDSSRLFPNPSPPGAPTWFPFRFTQDGLSSGG